MVVNSTENYTVSFFRNQCDYTKVLVCVCVCVLLMNCQSLREILPSSVILCVSCSSPQYQTNTYKWGSLHSITNLSNTVTCRSFSFPALVIPFPCSHFVTFCSSNPSFSFSLSPVCLFLTSPHSAAPGSVSPFLGHLFLLLTSYVSRVYFSCPL